MVFSYAFGVGNVQSAFALAFQIPNLFRRLFGEGALSAASIPVLTETLTRQGQAAMDNVAGRLMGLLMATLLGICLLAEVIVGGLYLAYGADPNTALTLGLTGLMMPYVVLVCCVATLGGMLNIFGRFALPAGMPILMNVFLITAALAAPHVVPGGPRWEIVLVGASVLVAGFVQLVVQWQSVRRRGLRLKLSLDARDPAIRRIGRTMLPMIAGLGAVQLNTFADALIAWWFVVDEVAGTEVRCGPAVLYFAQRLYHFPLGVFIVALATAIFPALSRSASAGAWDELGATLRRGIRAAMFIALPCMVGMILVRVPMVRVLFDRGAFRNVPQADLRVAGALAMYVLALWAYAMNHLVIRAFYAMQDARTPVLVASGTVVINLALNLILVQTVLREAGLALATAVVAMFQTVILLGLLSRRTVDLKLTRISGSIVRTLLATAMMGSAVYLLDRHVLIGGSSAIRLAGMALAGAAAYPLFARVLRCKELGELLRR